MGRNIRADLVGVVIVADGRGGRVILSAGDEVPEGVDVGDHVLEPEGGKPDPRKRDDPELGDPIDLDSLTVEQLREHADTLGVDLEGARKRDDILAILRR